VKKNLQGGYYDHHGKWYRVGGTELPYETVMGIGEGIDSYLMSN
jgi:hypothetical protein